MHTSRIVAYAAVLLAVACTDRSTPTSPPISADFQDAIHGGGNPHFYLLPPLVSQPNLTSERFLAGLAPDVHIRIKELARAGTAFIKCTNEPIDYLTAGELPRVRQYGLLWNSGARKYAGKVAAPCVYRLTVELGGTASQSGVVLGFADVQLLNSTTFKYLITGDYIRLPQDWVLPFWFFIGEGAISAATNPTGTPCTPAVDCKEAIVRKDALVTQTVVTPEVTAGVSLPPNSLVQDGVLRITKRVFAAPTGLAAAAATLSATGPECIPRSKMALPQFRDCYDFEFFPVNGDTGGDVFKAPVTVAMCVELDGLTPAQLAKRSLFQIFFYHPQTNRLDVLDNAPATFLPCETGRLAGKSKDTSPRGFAGVLQRGWHAALSGLRALVGPRPLFASSAVVHLGLGGKLCSPGTTCKLSSGTWGLPAELSINGGNGQTGTVGTAVATAPSVIVTDTSGGPLEGAVVTFSVLYGGGSATAVLDTTGPDGIAQVGSWTLGATPGSNYLMASVAGATPDSVIFAATGSQPGLSGYEVVQSSVFSLDASGGFVRETAQCPAGKVVLGGGAAVVGEGSGDFNTVIQESGPGTVNGGAISLWAVSIKNTDPSSHNVQIFAACANPPAGYQIVTNGDFSLGAAGGFIRNTAQCPAGKVVFGGGASVVGEGTADFSTRVQESGPGTVNGGAISLWAVSIKNEDNSTAHTVRLSAICAAAPSGYQVIPNGDFSLAIEGGRIRDTAQCPSGTLVLGGGATVVGEGTADFNTRIQESSPGTVNGGAISLFLVSMKNLDGSPHTVRLQATCAQASP